MPKVMYRSNIFNIERIRVRRNGKLVSFERMKEENTICVLPLTKEGMVLLERQYRWAIGRYIYELPAGHIDPGETAADAARRELEEETGYRPSHLKRLFIGYPGPGAQTELMTFFVAKGLVRTRKNLDDLEVITTTKVSMSRALQMVKDNRIRDNKSIACLLFYAMFSR